MQVDPETGLLAGARWLESPNQDARPDALDISLLVIHNISLPPGEFGGTAIEALFTNALQADAHPYFAQIVGQRVSAHLLIRRDGECIQFVPFNRRAWHAGASCYQSRENCNDYSIGIELEGTDDIAYTDAQYVRLAQVVATLLTTYPRLDVSRMVGHCDIAPTRKTDPGAAFDWHRLRTLLSAVQTHE